MTVTHLHHSPTTGTVRRHDHQQQPAREPAIGDEVTLLVARKLDDRRYLAVFGNTQRIVESAVELPVGLRVKASVAAVGEKLELRYLGTEAPIAEDTVQPAGSAGDPQLAALATRFRTTLEAHDRAMIERAMQAATDPTVMAASGLFLNKLALPIEEAALQAVYESQRWRVAGSSSSTLAAVADASSDAELADRLGAALDVDVATSPQAQSVGGNALDTADAETSARRDREDALRLLNLQDEGSVGYRYGVLPVLIGDQLVELDLAYFRERRAAAAETGMRRMVMTFSTPSLGRIEVQAQALADRLSISIKSNSAHSCETLASHAQDVRELIARLGWKADAVTYDVDPEGRRAAGHIVDHVLVSETLSRLL